MKLNLRVGSKKINLDVKKVGFFGKTLGLMFRTKNTQNLLFEFRKENRSAIHSFFVLFEFLAVWLDSEDKIIDVKKVKPFTPSIKPKFNFKKLIEIPINEENKEIIRLLVDRRKV